MASLLSIKQLSKRYGSFQALKDLDLEIEEGSCVGLLGANGAGKSTTIRMIIGQLRPTAGSISVLGMNPVVDPKKIHPFIGYIPDSQTLYEDLPVEDNIRIFAELFAKNKKAVDQILEQVQLIEKRKDKVKSLSKGLRQRVLIARALVHAPRFIILDEPTTGLDPSSADSIYKILEDLKAQGATILLTTHLMNDVDRLCDQIVFIDKGKKVEQGSPSELKRKHALPTLELEVEMHGKIETHTLPKSEGWVESLRQWEEKGEVLSIRTHEPKLEDIFIKLVRGTS